MIQLPGSAVPVQVKGILPNSTIPITLSAVASTPASPAVETAPEIASGKPAFVGVETVEHIFSGLDCSPRCKKCQSHHKILLLPRPFPAFKRDFSQNIHIGSH